MMRRLIGLALVLPLALSVLACSSSDDKGPRIKGQEDTRLTPAKPAGGGGNEPRSGSQ